MEEVTIVNTELGFKCPSCDRYFRKSTFLKCHYYKLHMQTNPYRLAFFDPPTPGEEMSVVTVQGEPEKESHSRTTSHPEEEDDDEDKPFKCKTCSKRFMQKRYLTYHLRTHSEERQHTCNMCGRAFKRPAALKVHIKTHTKEKDFQCEECGKVFALKANLHAHMLIHSREKPHACQLCNKGFAQKSNLRNHSCHQQDSMLKPFQCEECGVCFKFSHMLSVHMLKHNEHKKYFECPN